MKKDFEAIRLEMYKIVYAFQKGLGENSQITQTDLLDIFIDAIAGVYDHLQYFFDKVVKAANPAIVLYHKNSENFPEFHELLKLFRYRELDNYTKASLPLSFYREFYIGKDLELGVLAEYTEEIALLIDKDLTVFSRDKLLRALLEAWLYVIRDIDKYFLRLLDELDIEGESCGNSSGYAELFGFPLYQELPLTANVIYSKTKESSIDAGDAIEIEGEKWVPVESISFPYHNNVAFSEKVMFIDSNKTSIIVRRKCTNRVGDLLLLVGVGWRRYAVITGIIRTSIYAEYAIEYSGELPADPDYCVRVSNIEQRENKIEIFYTSGFLNQIIKLQDVCFKPEKGIKNALLKITVGSIELEYTYYLEEVGNYYTYRVDGDGNCYIVLLNTYDFDLPIKVEYWQNSVKSISSGVYLADKVSVEILEDCAVEKDRHFYEIDTSCSVSKEGFAKKFLKEYIIDMQDWYFQSSMNKEYWNNVLNWVYPVEITKVSSLDIHIKSTIPKTYYQRKSIAALYLLIYAGQKTFIQQDLT
ncbi:MAG: hypothetical protein EOM67_00470 [Spirochaetia bacterium]|nr:hypothetical protein [Spirochaetia bacterium]